jgi:hypothetical protein
MKRTSKTQNLKVEVKGVILGMEKDVRKIRGMGEI